jgi:hypothetical protein
MSYAAALAIILAASLAAAAATILAQRRVDLDLRRRSHDVGSVVFLQLGTVFAVFLAFAFSQVWSEYNETQIAIDQEVSALHGAAIIASTLPPPADTAILSAQRAYIESVVGQEWPVMAARRAADPGTSGKFVALLREAVNLRLTDPDDRDKKSSILALLAEAHVHRETRLYEAGAGAPAALWSVLIAFTIMMTLFVSLSQIQSERVAVAISACFAAGLVSILVIARLLDYPFEGATALGPADFVALIGKISDLARLPPT